MTTELDRAIALEQAGEGRFTVQIDPNWFVQTGPNGGYLAALLLRALSAVVGDRPPRSLSVQYLRSGVAGPAEIRVEVRRAGRSMSFLSAELRQGELVAVAQAAFGSGRPSGMSFQDDVPPESLPRPESLEAPDAPPMLTPSIADRFDYRPIERIPFFSGASSEFWCWLRLRDPRPVDAVVLALYVDAMIPSLFLRARSPMVVPTLDLTLHLRSAPASGFTGWCLGHVRSAAAVDGFADEDCWIYDANGVLLAQSRQLCMVVPLE